MTHNNNIKPMTHNNNTKPMTHNNNTKPMTHQDVVLTEASRLVVPVVVRQTFIGLGAPVTEPEETAVSKGSRTSGSEAGGEPPVAAVRTA